MAGFPENDYKFFEEAAEHPERLLVRLNAADGEILCFQVVRFPGGIAKIMGGGHDDLVRLDEVGDKILGRGGLDGEFFDTGGLGEGLETAGSEDVEGAKALGDVIDRGEEFLVLGLESGVELEKFGPSTFQWARWVWAMRA